MQRIKNELETHVERRTAPVSLLEGAVNVRSAVASVRLWKKQLKNNSILFVTLFVGTHKDGLNATTKFRFEFF